MGGITNFRLAIAMAVVAVALIAAPGAAWASTAQNTDVNNKAALTFTVSGSSSLTLESAPTGNTTLGTGSGTNTTFKVDRKVTQTVVKNADANVAPNTNYGSPTSAVLDYTITNTGNDTLHYALTWCYDSTSTFTPSGVRIYIDENGDGALDAGDTLYTGSLSNTGAAAQDSGTIDLVVITNTPSGATDGQVAKVWVIAQAVDNTGVAYTATAGADVSTTVETVLADADGSGAYKGPNGAECSTASADYDGYVAAMGTFTITSAQLTVTKTATTIWDPVNWGAGGATRTGDPKAIPGAVIRYKITVANDSGAGASAILTTISDTLAGSLAMEATIRQASSDASPAAIETGAVAGDGFKVTSVSDSCGSDRDSADGTSVFYTATSSADGIDHDGSATGGAVTATMSTVLEAVGTCSAGEIGPGDSVDIEFNALVQ
jgi:hypothetical protein